MANIKPGGTQQDHYSWQNIRRDTVPPSVSQFRPVESTPGNMNNIFIFACVLASCVAVRGFEVQQLADILGVPKNQFIECVEGNDLDNADFSRISQLLRSTKLNTDDQKLMNKFSCFLACIYEKGKIIEDDKIQLDSVLKIAEENDVPLTSEMKENLNACIDEANTKSDMCEASLIFSVCINDRWLRYGE